MLTDLMFSKLKRTAADMVAGAPGMPWLLRRAALAPPAIKTAGFARIASAIASRCDLDPPLVETNMGISDALRLSVPSCKAELLFSSPNHIVAERAAVALVRLLVSKSDAFLDVGANEGLFTFSVAAELPAAHHDMIHLFEPDTDLFARLKSNLEKNKIRANVSSMAISERAGRQIFFRNITDDSSGSLTEHFAEKHETITTVVDTTTLAQYLNSRDIKRACVKIDVEGAGVSVWTGASSQKDRIAWLVMEMIGPEVEAQLPRRIITETGWNAYYIRDYELIPSRAGEFQYVAPFYNWLFTSAEPSVLKSALKDSLLHIVDHRL